MATNSILQNKASLPSLKDAYPTGLFEIFREVAAGADSPAYLVGGAVRDWLLGNHTPGDIDLTVKGSANSFCKGLMAKLGGGALVPLGTESDEAARVVWQGLDIDVSSFRGDTETIEEDLALRDFTINSIAAPLEMILGEGDGLVDPLDGLSDLEAGVIRHCPRAFVDDPLRLLRAFRFMVRLGFGLAPSTEAEVGRYAGELFRVSAERIGYEMDLIISGDNGSEGFLKMDRAALLHSVLPELYDGDGVEQPGFHHLDVFHHNLQTLKEMEGLLHRSDCGFESFGERFRADIAGEGAVRDLKWAALLHDVGKPAARKESAKATDRVTFYGHDEIGREVVEGIGRRLKWSNGERERVGHLVAMHMHPFHLCTVRKERGLTRRAALKLCTRAGDQLQQLFLLAMADCLSSKGELKPETIEQELVGLYAEVVAIYDEHIKPVLECRPLLGGHDLINTFGLSPGPLFSVILKELQALQVEGKVHNRDEALIWVEKYLKSERTGVV